MESLSNGYFPGSFLKKGNPSRDPVEPSPPSPGWERREDRRPRRIPIPNSLLFGGRNKGEECRGNIRLLYLLSSERKPKRWMYPCLPFKEDDHPRMEIFPGRKVKASRTSSNPSPPGEKFGTLRRGSGSPWSLERG